MLAALSVLPAAALSSACAGGSELDLAEDELALGDRRPPDKSPPGRGCDDRDAVLRERLRWRRLVDLHMGEENAHDLPGVMQTFSSHGEMIFNGVPFLTPEAIAQGHVLFGMSQQPGALSATQVIPEREYFTDDFVLIEGRVVANHEGDIMGFVGTGKQVSLPYSAIYQFDRSGKLVSERIVMNWAPLALSALG
jgi:predicted ester cyclase